MSTREKFLKRAARETAELKRQALEYGIEIPHKAEWWWDDSEDLIESGVGLQELEYTISHYLTEEGKAGVRRLIREEQAMIKDRRIRWVCQIIAAITGLAGAIIGILAMLRK